MAKFLNYLRSNWERAFLVFMLVLAIPTITFLPRIQVMQYRASIASEDIDKLDAEKRVQLQDKLFVAENSARVTIAQIFGGLFVLFSVLIALKNAEIAQGTLRVTEEGKITDRFSKAVELLGDDKLDVRLGGVYALQRIAWDSYKDHWTVIEVLTAFIREKSQADYREYQDEVNKRGTVFPFYLAEDIQAALTVIARRKDKWRLLEKPYQRINLRKAVLEGAMVVNAHLAKADLSFANLNGAKLPQAILSEANLFSAKAVSTDLRGANLYKAVVDLAEILGTILDDANLNNARLTQTKLCYSRLRNTQLKEAVMIGTDLDKADLQAADLRKTDLSQVQNLEVEQLSKAIIDEKTKLPFDSGCGRT
jgi:Pentapeptide repeats (8 copies)